MSNEPKLMLGCFLSTNLAKESMDNLKRSTIAPKRRGPLRILARMALFPLGMAAYLFIVFEEWLWERAKRAMARLAQWPAVALVEKSLAQARPAVAALAFLIPAIMLFPFKLAGLFLISHGHAAMGLAVFVVAKAVGAAAVARVWTLTEPALRRIGWLSRSIDWVLFKKNAIKAWVLGIWAVRMAKSAFYRMRSGARSARARFAHKLWGRALFRAKKDMT
jgi:hypothetical protein